MELKLKWPKYRDINVSQRRYSFLALQWLSEWMISHSVMCVCMCVRVCVWLHFMFAFLIATLAPAIGSSNSMASSMVFVEGFSNSKNENNETFWFIGAFHDDVGATLMNWWLQKAKEDDGKTLPGKKRRWKKNGKNTKVDWLLGFCGLTAMERNVKCCFATIYRTLNQRKCLSIVNGTVGVESFVGKNGKENGECIQSPSKRHPLVVRKWRWSIMIRPIRDNNIAICFVVICWIVAGAWLPPLGTLSFCRFSSSLLFT